MVEEFVLETLFVSLESDEVIWVQYVSLTKQTLLTSEYKHGGDVDGKDDRADLNSYVL